MKHTELKSFVRKYNSEFAIKGYSKMKKQPLTDEVKRVISKSRAEIQKEWRELNKSQPKKVAKSKAKSKKPVKKFKETKKKQEQDKANRKADDAYHSQHKAGEGGDQGRKMGKAVSRTERRYRIQKDTALARRIRGPH